MKNIMVFFLLITLGFSLFADDLIFGASVNTIPEVGLFARSNNYYMNMSLWKKMFGESSEESPDWFSMRCSIGYNHTFPNRMGIIGGLGFRYLNVHLSDYFIFYPEVGVTYTFNSFFTGILIQPHFNTLMLDVSSKTDSSRYLRSSVSFIIGWRDSASSVTAGSARSGEGGSYTVNIYFEPTRNIYFENNSMGIEIFIVDAPSRQEAQRIGIRQFRQLYPDATITSVIVTGPHNR